MEEVIKYFESLEARIAAQEERLAAQAIQIAELEAKVTKLEDDHEQIESIEHELRHCCEIVDNIQLLTLSHYGSKSETQPVKSEEPIVEEPVAGEAPEPVNHAEEPVVEEPVVEEPVIEEPVVEEPVVEPEKEIASPNAALYGKAVSDIRQAISLGDRFLFQRELFAQNAELMQRTLTELNSLSSFDEAVKYISRFGWDTESNTYQQFIVTLHRRFG